MLFLINAMLFQSLFISKHVQVSSKDQEPQILMANHVFYIMNGFPQMF